jgi:hypothetical protein
VFYDTLIWRLSLDDDLQKQGLASRSECANLQAGGRGFESHHLHHQPHRSAARAARRPGPSGFAPLVRATSVPLGGSVARSAGRLAKPRLRFKEGLPTGWLEGMPANFAGFVSAP